MKTHLLLLLILILPLASYADNLPSKNAEELPVDLTVTLVSDVSCYGGSDGSATVVIAGLSSLFRYSYVLTNSADEVVEEGTEGLLDDLISDLLDLNTGLTLRFEDLSADTYTLTWTARPLLIGPSTTKTASFTIGEPDELKIIDLNIIDLSCINPTGSIEVLTSGGLGGIDLGILNLGEILNIGGDGNTITDLTEGIYNIIVTDENGCQADTTAEVEYLIEFPEVEIIGDLDLGCHDLLELDVTSSDGVQLTLDTPDGNIVGGLLGNSFSVNTPGLYVVSALDVLNGCVSSDTVEVVANIDIPLLDAGTDRILGCLDDLELTAITDATSIVWENLSGNVLSNNNVLEVSAPGTYVAVALNYLTGCEARDTVIVEPGDESDNTTIDFDLGATYNLGCLNVLDLVVINPSSLAIQWGTIGGNILGSPGQDIIRIDEPGVYIASGIDLVTGCLVSDTIRITADANIGPVTIEEEEVYLPCEGTLIINADIDDIDANVSLLWETISGGALIDDEGTTAEVDAAGVYVVVATNLITKCSTSDTITVLEPEPIEATATTSSPSCNSGSDGSIDITVSGGTPPYTYAWSTGATTEDISGLTAGTYSVTISDANDCSEMFSFTLEPTSTINVSLASASNASCDGSADGSIALTVTGGTAPYTYAWSNGATTKDISGLSAGTYSVTVTDANGCSNTAFSHTIEEPSSISVSLQSSSSTVCDGASSGSIALTVTGGTAPYTYAWSNGATTKDISGLPAGTYSVTVTDANGCTDNSFSHTIEESSPMEITLEGLTSESCAGSADGSIDISVSGGTAPYTYAWSNGATTEDVSGLSAGTYSVTVTDDLGCQASMTYTIESADPIEVEIVVNSTSFVTQLTANPTGGTAPYQYSWSNGSTAATINVQVVQPTDYTVVVTDANGCTGQATERLGGGGNENPDTCFMTYELNVTQPMGDSLGSAEISASNGVEPYQFLWSTGETTASISGLTPGIYTINIKDAAFCNVTDTFEIVEDTIVYGCPSDIIVDNCDENVYYDIPVYQSDMAYTVTQINGLCSGSIFPMGSNRVSFLVMYEDGSFEICNFNIIVAPSDYNIEVNHPSCPGASDGSVTLNLTDSTDYYIAWDDAQQQQGPMASNLSAGQYTVMGMNSAGCIVNSTVTLEDPQPIELMNAIVLNAVDTSATGQIHVTITGGTYPLTFAWEGPDGFMSDQEDLINIKAGSYSLMVVDANGCSMDFGPFVVESEQPQNSLENLSTARRAPNYSRATLYPNPSEGIIMIDLTLEKKSPIEIVVFNMLGQAVSQQEYTEIESGKLTLNLEGIEAGQYWINIKSEAQVFSKKVTIF